MPRYNLCDGSGAESSAPCLRPLRLFCPSHSALVPARWPWGERPLAGATRAGRHIHPVLLPGARMTFAHFALSSRILAEDSSSEGEGLEASAVIQGIHWTCDVAPDRLPSEPELAH
jgi:hypothetical protein